MNELRMAFDRSLRRFDAAGRLHVDICNISKANVCPYYGREIMGGAMNGGDLKLDPDRIYNLYRDPAELQRSLPTWNNIQLLIKHIGVSADMPQSDSVVGSTGTDAHFSDPYLCNSLVVWTAEAIDLVNAEEQRELSCGYQYFCDLTPGEADGLPFDGTMRNIVGNHVALVKEGRAGPDVLVADSKPESRPVSKLTSKKALLVRGALIVAARPLIAADHAIDYQAVLGDVTAANFAEMKPKIIERITADTKGKLKSGVSLSSLSLALDAMEGEEEEGEDCMEEDEDLDATDEDPDKDKEAKDKAAKDKAAKDKAAKDKSAKDAAAKDKRARDEAERREREGMDAETEDEASEREDREEAEDRARDGLPKSGAAMDKMIGDAVTRGVTRERIRMERIAEAKDLVRPHVGTITGDSGEAILRVALDSAGVKLAGGEGFNTLKTMVGLLRQPDTSAGPTRYVGDSATGEDPIAAMFGDAKLIKA